jgi:hypothetical protein
MYTNRADFDQGDAGRHVQATGKTIRSSDLN